MGFVDGLIAYKFLEIISTPWVKQDAYRLGIIDEKGNILIQRKNLRTPEQQRAYPSVFYTLCWNIKRILQEIPGVRTNLGTFLSSLWFLKEGYGQHAPTMEWFETEIAKILVEKGETLAPMIVEDGESFSSLVKVGNLFGHGLYIGDGEWILRSEDAPTVNVGDGKIAGAVPGEDPPGPRPKKKRKLMSPADEVDQGLEEPTTIVRRIAERKRKS